MLVWVPHLCTCVSVCVCVRLCVWENPDSGASAECGSPGDLRECRGLGDPLHPTPLPQIPHLHSTQECAKYSQNVPQRFPENIFTFYWRSLHPSALIFFLLHSSPSPRTQVHKLYILNNLTWQAGTALTFLKCDVLCKHQAFESPWEELIWLQSMQTMRSGMQNILRRGCFAEICILRGQFWPVLTRCIFRRGGAENKRGVHYSKLKIEMFYN